MSILYVRDKNGNFAPMRTIKGSDGKSAYEQAVEGGYKGSLDEFIALLNGLTDEAATSEEILNALTGGSDV